MFELTTIVFSKNRPLQLYALLESMRKNTDIPLSTVNVLYAADYDFILAMEDLKDAFPEVQYHQEYDFRKQTEDLVKTAKDYVVFFTDDDVFKNKVSYVDPCFILHNNPHVVCFSLRLGKHLNYCYSTKSPQTVPVGKTREPFFFWPWKNASWDWNYVFSVDGHVFRKSDIQTAIKMIDGWKSPNSFEGMLSHLHPQLPHPEMASHTESSVLNIPHNKVQTEVANEFGGGSEYEFLDIWNSGKKIDISTFHKIKNISAHQLIPLTFIKR